MKNFSLAVCLVVIFLLAGGCIQVKQTLLGSVVPAKAGYYINAGQGWKTLDQLDLQGAILCSDDFVSSYDAAPEVKGGADRIVPLQVVGNKVLVAKRLTPTEQEGRMKLGGALDEAANMSCYGLLSKDEVRRETNIISREDRSDYDSGYILLEYTLDGKFPFYAIFISMERGEGLCWIVAMR